MRNSDFVGWLFGVIAVASLVACSARPLGLPLPGGEPAPAPLSFADATRACALGAACGIPALASSAEQCLSDLASIFLDGDSAYRHRLEPSQAACIARATDCVAAHACLVATTDECIIGETCRGDVIVSCRDGTTAASFDCASIGRSCVGVASATASCGLGACSPGGATHCDGDRLVWCTSINSNHPSEGVLLVVNDCGARGQRCIEEAIDLGCQGAGGPCTRGTRCDGDVLVSCVLGHESRRDCATAGLRCLRATANAACGFAPR